MKTKDMSKKYDEAISSDDPRLQTLASTNY